MLKLTLPQFFIFASLLIGAINAITLLYVGRAIRILRERVFRG